MRKYLVFVVSLLLLCASFATVLATEMAREYRLRGYVDATQRLDLPYRVPRLGINVDLFQYTETELRQHLAWMQEAQINWARQHIYWDAFEAVRGVFRWHELDSVMTVLADYPQIKLVPVFMNSPAWARTGDHITAPPDDPNDIATFLYAFAQRYGEEIDYYQVWDEPNLDDAWGLQAPNAADYTALLAVSYGSIHSADRDATVITAALAPTTEVSGLNIADSVYLTRMYQQGAAPYFDAVGAKPYGFDTSPADRTVSLNTLNFSRLILMREVMVTNGDGHKAVWASNWGWNALPDDWTGDPSIWGQVTQSERLDYTINAIARAEREWPWLGGLILHHWQPDVVFGDPQWGFAVINQQNQPTELWQALVAYDFVDAARNGLYHPRTEYARYSGVWTFSELGADIGWLETSDSQLTFNFFGADVALKLREGDYFAFLYPTVDGEQANATPRDASGNSYLLLRSGTRLPEINLVSVSRDLASGYHQLAVTADRGWDQWALAGYAVSDGNLHQPYRNQIAVAWLATLSSFIATIVSGYFLPWHSLYRRSQRLISIFNDGAQFLIASLTSVALMLGLLISFGTSEPSIFRRALIEQGTLVTLTWGLFAIELPFIISLIGILILFYLIFHHLYWGLILTLFYAPFFLFPVELHTYFFPMSELLILITALAWALRGLIWWGLARQSANTDYPIRTKFDWHPLDILMGVWVGLGIVGIIVAARPTVAMTEFRTLFVEPFLFYAIARTIKLDREQMRQMILSVIGAGMAVSVIGIVLFLANSSVITAESGVRRLASVYGSPNNVGLFIERIIPFVLVAVLALGGSKRVISTAILGLLLLTVALTQSVGAILIGVPASIIAVVLMYFGRRALPVVGLMIIGGVMATALLTQVSVRFASLLDLSTGTNFIRLRVWESSLEIVRDNPLFGLGLDQFLYEFRGHYLRPDAIVDPDLSHPHNVFLDFWIRLGAGGLALLIIWIVACWRTINKILAHVTAPWVRTLSIGIAGGLVATLAHGLIDNSIYVNDLIYVFVLQMVLLAQLDIESRPNSQIRQVTIE